MPSLARVLGGWAIATRARGLAWRRARPLADRDAVRRPAVRVRPRAAPAGAGPGVHPAVRSRQRDEGLADRLRRGVADPAQHGRRRALGGLGEDRDRPLVPHAARPVGHHGGAARGAAEDLRRTAVVPRHRCHPDGGVGDGGDDQRHRLPAADQARPQFDFPPCGRGSCC